MKWQFARVQQKEIYTKYIVQRVLSNENYFQVKIPCFRKHFCFNTTLGSRSVHILLRFTENNPHLTSKDIIFGISTRNWVDLYVIQIVLYGFLAVKIFSIDFSGEEHIKRFNGKVTWTEKNLVANLWDDIWGQKGSWISNKIMVLSSAFSVKNKSILIKKRSKTRGENTKRSSCVFKNHRKNLQKNQQTSRTK